MKISFIIPCGRMPFEKSGQKTVDSILKHHPDEEIIVSSKEKIHYKNIISIQEREDNIGCVGPCNAMAGIARGDFICMINDDYYLSDNSIYPVIEYLQNKKLMGLTLLPYDGRETGVGKCPFYDNKVSSWLDTIMFPVVSRYFIKNHGELMYYRLKHYYGDNTISIRLWKDYNQTEFVYNNDKIYVHSMPQIANSLFTEQSNEFKIYQQFLNIYNIEDTRIKQNTYKFKKELHILQSLLDNNNTYNIH